MNSKKILLIFINFLLILCINNVKALRYTVTITGNAVGLRSDVSIDSDRLGNMYKGESYTAISNTLYPSKSGCSAGWYNITYGGVNGYVCAKYATLNEIPDSEVKTCEEELKSAGFPDSYIGKLCDIKVKYSNWEFIPLITNQDWAYAISKEAVCNKNYVYTSNDEYKDFSCNNPYSSGWYPASQKALAYYMDPRNWLDEKHIFQFEDLNYSSDLKTIYPSSVNSILKNASFYKYHVTNDFANILNEAGESVGAHPIFLASRILQELGTTTKTYDLYSGVYPGFEGYYNFFNYGVSDSCATTYGRAYCGLTYAKNNGWNSLYNALSGGATRITNSYIKQRQYTLYLQKYNVYPLNSSSIYVHQYMSNVSAPSTEAVSMYNSYSASNLLQSSFTFYIPVYINMGETINNENNGGSGDGTEDNTTTIDINTVIKSGGFKSSDGYITGISIGYDVSSFISSITSLGAKISVKDASGNLVDSDIMKTGYKAIISNKNSTEEFNIVVKGDTSGDGKVNALDLLQVQKNILGLYNMSGAYLLAGDTSGDGKINALDLLQVQKQILGLYTIEQ